MRRSPSLQLSRSNPCRSQPESWITPTTMPAARPANFAHVELRKLLSIMHLSPRLAWPRLPS
jgi:hypothetical protein